MIFETTTVPAPVLTRAEAWGVIAAKILNAGHITAGLCREVAVLYLAGCITYNTRTTMIGQVLDHLFRPDQAPLCFAYPRGTCHEERAMAALWMMEEALAEDGV